MAHAHGDHHHRHDPVAFVRAEVEPTILRTLDAAHPTLSEILSLSAKYSELTEDEKDDLADLHEDMIEEGPWLVGFHADGDACAVCRQPVPPLFVDRLEDAAIAWGPFASDLPVHVRCMGEFPEKYPRLSPRVVDEAKRVTMRDLTRPSAQLASRFRQDLLAQGDVDVEAWMQEVAEANEDRMDRALQKDIEKCAAWLHQRLHHHHDDG